MHETLLAEAPFQAQSMDDQPGTVELCTCSAHQGERADRHCLADSPCSGLLDAALALSLQVYRHHCVGQLSEKHRRMRDCALYIAGNVNATKWALELYGFRDVAIPIQAMQMSDSVDGTVSPVLLNVRLSIRLSL